MSKKPDQLKVKFTISDIALEVPKHLFEYAGIKAAVFFGRKGKPALTRRTKWFTIADVSEAGSSTRQMVALPEASEGARVNGSQHASTTRVGEDSQETSLRQVAGELAVLNYGGLNNVVYETELTPLTKFDGEWVFDQKLTHPVTVFAKVFVKTRPNARPNAAKSEQDSNLNEMLQLDQSELDEDEYSNSDAADGMAPKDINEESQMDFTDMALTAEQLALLTDGKTEDEVLTESLINEVDCKKRYLGFPKVIDLSSAVNTKSKSVHFSERVKSKSATLVGSVISFTLNAEIDEGKLSKYEEKKKDKEDKEERKRREKEEKVLEKERKKHEKESAKNEKEERKKSGDVGYGCDVGSDHGKSSVVVRESSKAKPGQQPEKQKSGGFSPINVFKGIFSSKDKNQTTPFAIKYTSTPLPYLIMLDHFSLRKLVMPPEYYRAVHIRMGNDAVSVETFPLLLLSAENKNCVKEVEVKGYDGNMKKVFQLDFGNAHAYFADKRIRGITGFETVRALMEQEKDFENAQKLSAQKREGSIGGRQDSSDLFRADLLNVGEKFQPVEFESTKYSTNGVQVESTKFTRVTAQLIVPKDTKSVRTITDEEEKKAYFKKLKKEQKQREKEEIARAKGKKVKGSADDGKGEFDLSDDSSDAPEGESDKHEASAPAEHATTEESDDDKSSVDFKEEDPASENEQSADKSKDNKPADSDKEKSAELHESETPVASTFESGGTAAREKSPKSSSAEKESRICLNKTRSFQLGFHLLNEENIRAGGIHYSIRFETGEELVFRARRVFLPSLCAFGKAGASRDDVPLLKFTPDA